MYRYIGILMFWCVDVDALMCLLPASIASPELIFNLFIHSFHSLIDSSHAFIHASHSSKLLSCHIMSCHVISYCLIHHTIHQSYICMRALGWLLSCVFRLLPFVDYLLEESRNLWYMPAPEENDTPHMQVTHWLHGWPEKKTTSLTCRSHTDCSLAQHELPL